MYGHNISTSYPLSKLQLQLLKFMVPHNCQVSRQAKDVKAKGALLKWAANKVQNMLGEGKVNNWQWSKYPGNKS